MIKSRVHLLDANVLIALATPEHSLNARAAAWFRKGPPVCDLPHHAGRPHPFPPSGRRRCDGEIGKAPAGAHFLFDPARILARRCFLS